MVTRRIGEDDQSWKTRQRSARAAQRAYGRLSRAIATTLTINPQLLPPAAPITTETKLLTSALAIVDLPEPTHTQRELIEKAIGDKMSRPRYIAPRWLWDHYPGAALRAIRAEKGVGRPPVINIWRHAGSSQGLTLAKIKDALA